MSKTFDQVFYDSLVVAQWIDLNNGKGPALNCELLDPVGVAFEGEFDGAEVILEGSIGAQFFPIVDRNGSVISATSECLLPMSRTCLQVRPKILNGTAKTSISVYVLCNEVPKKRLGR